MMSHRVFAAVLASVFSVGAAIASDSTIDSRINRVQSEVVTVPQRVVSYDLATLDIMQALGIPVAGVPKAQFPTYMSSYSDDKYVIAGSLFEPDYDALSKIRPDLIIVGGRSAAKAGVLGKVAPTLNLSVRKEHMLQDIEGNITQIAKLYGKQKQGDVLIAKINKEISELRALAAQAQPGLLLMAVNEKIMPNTPDSRFGFLFDVFGAKSALTSKGTPPRGTAYTFNDVAKLNPEWIYVIDRNTGTGSAAGGGEIIPSQKVFDNEKVNGTVAAKKGQVVFLDPKGWYLMGSTGPTALLNNIAQLKLAYEEAGLR